MSETRIYVPVSAETRAQLQALADARKCSLAAVGGEILENTAPVAGEMAKALRIAQEAPAAALRNMEGTLAEQLAQIGQIELELAEKARPRRKYVKSKK